MDNIKQCNVCSKYYKELPKKELPDVIRRINTGRESNYCSTSCIDKLYETFVYSKDSHGQH